MSADTDKEPAMRFTDYDSITASTAQTLHNQTRAAVSDPGQRPPRWEDLSELERRAKIRAVSPAVTAAIPHAVAAAYRSDAEVLADPGDPYFRFLTERLHALAESYEAMAEPLPEDETSAR